MDSSKLTRIDALKSVIADTTTKDEAGLLEAVLDAFDNTIVVTDPNQEDNPIVYVNKGFEDMTGYKAGEILGKNCRFLQNDDRDQPGLAKLREGIRKQEFTSVLLRNYRKDGSMFWNELHVTPIFDENGDLILFSGVQNDVTSREGLSSERAFLNAAVQNTRESIVITGTELERPGPHILYVNPAFERLTGYTAEEVKGRSPRLLQGPKSDPKVLERLRRALSAGESFHGETVNYRKDGSEFINAWQIAPIKLGGGDIDYWVATQRDVTQRRQLERQVLNAAVTEQNRIARDLHDGVVQEIGAAHLMASRLLRQLEQRGSVKAEELAELTEQLKAAMVHTRNLSHGVSTMNLGGSGLMIALETLTRTLTASSEQEVSFTFETPVIIQDAERGEQLYRIAQEALSNALRHSGASEIRILLSGTGQQTGVNGSENEPSDYALSIYDNGSGLPAGADTGTGVGLANMHHRAQSIGASLSVDDAQPQGTIVTCRFTA